MATAESPIDSDFVDKYDQIIIIEISDVFEFRLHSVTAFNTNSHTHTNADDNLTYSLAALRSFRIRLRIKLNDPYCLRKWICDFIKNFLKIFSAMLALRDSSLIDFTQFYSISQANDSHLKNKLNCSDCIECAARPLRLGVYGLNEHKLRILLCLQVLIE